MDIKNLDYIVPTKSNRSSADPGSITGGFSLGQLTAFISRANSFSTSVPDISSISMLDDFPEGYFYNPAENGSDKFAIVDMATSASPMSSGGHPAFRSVAGGGYVGNNGIFSFSSSAAKATL